MELARATLAGICGLGCIAIGSCFGSRDAWQCERPAADPRAHWSVECAAVLYGAHGPLVRPVGDTNGDGVGDLALLLPEPVRGGAVMVHSGRDGGLLVALRETSAWPRDAWGLALDASGARAVAVLAQDEVEAFDARTGESLWKAQVPDRAVVGAAGDVDGDGAEDLAVGTLGRLDARSGRDGRVLWSRLVEPDPEHAWNGAGVARVARVRGGEDLDGDGRADLVLATGDPRASSGAGFVWRLSGRGDARPELLAARPDEASFGASLDWTDDRDGDGVRDLLTGSDSGVRVVSTANGRELEAYAWAETGDELRQVLDCGDVDGDGLRDHLVLGMRKRPGASLHAGSGFELRSGRTHGALHARTHGMRWLFDGVLVAAAGDVDGDGRADLALLRPAVSRRNVDFVPCEWFRPPRSRLEVLLAKDLLGAR